MPFLDLPNTKGERDARHVKTGRAAVRAALDGFVGCAYDDNGGLDIWRDDDGVLRGSHCRFMRSLDKPVFKSQAAAVRWFNEKLPLIQ